MTTTIEWTRGDDGSPGVSWNPTRGCSRVSPGCVNCYAERQAGRFAGSGGPYEGLLHPTGAWNGRIRTVESALNAPYHWRKPRRVFVDSMSDLFHEAVPFDFIDKVFDTMLANPRHTFQILTKRPDRMSRYVKGHSRWKCERAKLPRHIWLGTSCEDQATADERIPTLTGIRTPVLFVSFEPMLGPIDPALICGINWAIIGGESGPGARSCAISWIDNLVRKCKSNLLPTFVKQLGANPVDDFGQRLPYIHQRKGNDMAEWPEHLRVREWPAVEER
jgi:protein gp37